GGGLDGYNLKLSFVRIIQNLVRMRRQLTLEQRIYVCKCYYKYESARRIDKPRSKFETTGSVQNKKHTRGRDPIARVREDNISSIFYK
ncbi:hypothetical protein L9F63_011764, partial [Diploptera punctata]